MFKQSAETNKIAVTYRTIVLPPAKSFSAAPKRKKLRVTERSIFLIFDLVIISVNIRLARSRIKAVKTPIYIKVYPACKSVLPDWNRRKIEEIKTKAKEKPAIATIGSSVFIGLSIDSFMILGIPPSTGTAV